MSRRVSVKKMLGLDKHSESKSNESSNESKYGDVVIFGAHKVGKTAIADRFVHNYFTEQYNPTAHEARYTVDALIETEDTKEEKTKKKMILKKSFKKSVMGKSRPTPAQKTLKRVVSTNTAPKGGADDKASGAYAKGIEQGLKRLKFVLVDTPSDIKEMEPLGYQAIIANGAAFFLVCSFDVAESLSYIEATVKDIRKAKAGSTQTPIIIIANKSDINPEERVMDALDVNTRAAQLKVKYCLASVASEEGCEDMASLLLNEINVSAEHGEYLSSLPEDYAFLGDGLV